MAERSKILQAIDLLEEWELEDNKSPYVTIAMVFLGEAHSGLRGLLPRPLPMDLVKALARWNATSRASA